MSQKIQNLLGTVNVRLCISQWATVTWPLDYLFLQLFDTMKRIYAIIDKGPLLAPDIVTLSFDLKELRWLLWGMGTFVNRTNWLHVWCFHMVEFAQYWRNLKIMGCWRLEALNTLVRRRFYNASLNGHPALKGAHEMFSVQCNMDIAGEGFDEEFWSDVL